MRVAIVGCGDIAARYAAGILREPELELVGATDLVAERAEALTREFGGRVYRSLDEILADDDVDAVVNLTVHHAHADVTAAALEAGKHVHTEKPVALAAAEAWRLTELADVRGRRLSCAPATWMGEGQQTAWRLIRDGHLGRVRVAYAEVNWGKIELWHRSPVPFYEVGALWDVGVYPLTILTAFFGPARRVAALARFLEPERVTLGGERFALEVPDFVVALVELEDGPLVRLTASFYAESLGRQRGIEFHGDDASLHLASWAEFDSRVAVAPRRREYAEVPLVRDGFRGIDFVRPVADLAAAIREGRPHYASAAHAAHVVEVLEAIDRAAATGTDVAIATSFERPAPLAWALA